MEEGCDVVLVLGREGVAVGGGRRAHRANVSGRLVGGYPKVSKAVYQ